MKYLFTTLFVALFVLPTFCQYDLYWTDQHTNSVSISKADKEAEVLFKGENKTGRIRINSANQKVYWADQLTGIIYESNFEGDEEKMIIKTNSTVSVFAIDQINQHIYYVEDDNHRIMRANIDGSKKMEFTTDVGLVRGIAFDDASQTVFFSDLSHGTISRKNMSGGEVTVIFEHEEMILFDIASDPINEQLYFSDRGSNSILRIDFNGQNWSSIIELNNLAGAIAIDPEFSKIFYRAGDQINSINFDGTDVIMLVEGIRELSGLAVFNESMMQSALAHKKE